MCMDYTMIDLTDIPEAKVDDEVILFGKQGDEFISIQEYAKLYKGTACEVSTSIGSRVTRKYIYEGNEY